MTGRSLPELLSEDNHWLDLLEYLGSGHPVPAALGMELPLPFQAEAAEILARHILCNTGRACGTCQSCLSWAGGTHPDWIIAGAPDQPPSIDECRTFTEDLALSPVEAPVRLLTVFGTEKLNPSVANSLLKVTEEPPPHGRLLYLMSQGNILATLKSRLWMLAFRFEEHIEPQFPPVDDPSWLTWLAEGEKRTPQDWYTLAMGYIVCLRQKKRFKEAALLCQLAENAQSAHLSSAMWTDMLYLFLRGEYPFDHVFDDFRQASLFRACRRG